MATQIIYCLIAHANCTRRPMIRSKRHPTSVIGRYIVPSYDNYNVVILLLDALHIERQTFKELSTTQGRIRNTFFSEFNPLFWFMYSNSALKMWWGEGSGGRHVELTMEVNPYLNVYSTISIDRLL